MVECSKIRYYDLTLEALKGRLPDIVGRGEECARLLRVISRRIHHHCLIVGASGVGKTTLVHAWAKQRVEHGQSTLPIVELDPGSFEVFNSATAAPLQKYQEALESIPPCILFVDDFGHLVHHKPTVLYAIIQLLATVAQKGTIQLLLAMELQQLKWVEQEQPSFLNRFEVIPIKTQPSQELERIVHKQIPRLSGTVIRVDERVGQLTVQLAERFSILGQLPAAAITIVDECIALARSSGSRQVREDDVYRIVSDKIGVGLSQLKQSEKELLKNLEGDLNREVIGQKPAIGQIVSIIRRAKLGLKSPNRPLGSFLILGPSGVGKTETAKRVAHKMFGKKESFVRIDMSEFRESHTVARLIGAPAGYVGYDEGGGLTNAVRQEPYSIILLDELEKAHPSIFNIFLQILDDGRLTSGQGETVDFTQTIIMATSNIAVSEIIQGFGEGVNIHSGEFLRNNLIPVLTSVFRPEFINRFDAVLVFKPLTESDLFEIAKLEIRNVQQRVATHRIAFKIDPTVLFGKIRALADPRFGARPIKRYVEATCENLISQKLLSS